LRIAAPRSALTLGRAVSLDDFEALARGFPGVVNAAAAWAFDGRLQRATVKIWIISDGGDPSADLRASLRANADPQVPIVVTLATAVPLDLSVSLEISDTADPATVRPAARAALLDPATGLFAPANVAIGRPRSAARSRRGCSASPACAWRDGHARRRARARRIHAGRRRLSRRVGIAGVIAMALDPQPILRPADDRFACITRRSCVGLTGDLAPKTGSRRTPACCGRSSSSSLIRRRSRAAASTGCGKIAEIDTADEWAVPYIADLVATRLLRH
jgi:hypothetical protein